MYKVDKFFVGYSILVLLLIIVLCTGCSVNIPIVENSHAYNYELSKPEEYSELVTFEYTVEDLELLNKEMGYDYFDFTKLDNAVTIDGYISDRPINNETDVIENIKMIRSMLGLVNPEEQLRLRSSSDDCYSYAQYYNGIRVYNGHINVNIDNDKRLITYTTSVITPVEVLKKIGMKYILSEKEIVADTYKGKTVDELVIWNEREYAEKPVVAYILNGDEEKIVVNAHDGAFIDSWSTIMIKDSKMLEG